MSLSTLVLIADVAQRQTQVCCNPWPFRLDQDLLGAFHLPQVPQSSRRAVAGRPFASSGEVTVSPALAGFPRHPFRPRGVQSYICEPVVSLGVANALTTWRQAKVCLRPLHIKAVQSLPAAIHSSTGVPIRAVGQRSRATGGRRLAGLLRGLFGHRVGGNFGPPRGEVVPIRPVDGLTAT